MNYRSGRTPISFDGLRGLQETGVSAFAGMGGSATQTPVPFRQCGLLLLGQCRHSCVRRNAAVQRWTAAVRCVRVWEIFKFEVWFSGDVKGRYLCRLGRVGFLATLAASRPWQFSRQFSQASIVFDTRAEAVHLHLRQIVTVEP